MTVTLAITVTKSGGHNANSDKPNLDSILHNSKKKHANGHFAYANNHKTRNLTEQFILDSREIGDWITDISVQSP